MRRAHEFYEVYDTQLVFRSLMEAFANPGRAVSIKEPASRLNLPHGVCMVLAMALLDNTTTFFVAGADALVPVIEQYTFARPAPAAQSAFLFVMEPCDEDAAYALLFCTPCGTLEEPHLGATVIVRIPTLTGGVTLKGPGINGTIEAPLGEEGRLWLKSRDRVGAEYPCGVDLVFLTDEGALLAVPRLVRQA